ncbi:TGF-beta-activated kinase 1 and MAP3K7-binding protein like [Melia azedarach]|uniref:TGF-beta-activated kinase 1 and MAP3K7-binding protein like n=1 Tax=Melia azedarach TaxID=155640 RepID=A0ACC1XEX0_MELAZ|nr:TGF-beta-activated kinase 1 and MAP3K7-binding protein like [Melia azedarach]
MASSLAAVGFCHFCPCRKQKKQPKKFPQVRSSQSFRDEGKSADMVDANLSILKKRIEEVRKKEMVMKNRSCRAKHGWNYKPGYDHKQKRADIFCSSMEMIGFIGGALGFVFLSGTLCIFLVSFLVSFSN